MSDNNGDKPASDKKAPGFWFYTADFERDVLMLSLDAQGLWIRMLCWMSDNEEHRGFCEAPNGSPLSGGDIANRVGRSSRRVQTCLDEMERLGIFSRDDRGCIYSRRMARDTHISEVRKAAAKSRHDTERRAANGQFAGGFAPAKSNFAPTKVHANGMQKPTVTASVPVPVPVLKQQTQRVFAPKELASPSETSERFEEFWERYPVKDGKPMAFGVWAGLVTVTNEAAVFACLERYLASDRGGRSPKNPNNWLHDCARDDWQSDWPRPAPQNGSKGTTLIEHMMAKEKSNGK